MECGVQQFPCRYLGLPISISRLPKSAFLHLLDKLANYLPGWKAALLHPAGRATLIKAVLSAASIHHLIAVQCPKWVYKAIAKILRGFMWKGHNDMQGGHCVVSWARVCRPRELGGLGIHNLEMLGWALQMRWLWLKKTQPDRVWAEFDFQVHPNVTALFAVSVVSMVGDGNNTCFWMDRWLHGESIVNLAPMLVQFVQKRTLHRRTVREAMTDLCRINDIRGTIPNRAFYEFILLWDALQGVHLDDGVQDQHRWTATATGSYSSKSAYNRYMAGTIGFESATRIWKTWVPPRCKFFLWLASLNRCWTADRLAKRGMEHPDRCKLCDQEEETIQHILVGCVFSREVWF